MTWPVPPRRGLTADELAQVHSVTVDRLTAMLPELSDDEWQQGSAWYESAHRTAQGIADEFGSDVRTVTGVIAALSPRVTWETNLDETRDCFVYGEDWGYAALRDNVDKALDIIAGSDPEVRLGGRKVRSFWRNMLDPWASLDVTLDGWMATCLMIPGGEKAYKYITRRGVYDAISDGFRTVADTIGVRPHELQATAWLSVRNGTLVS